jgi:hypothetical protein
VDRRGGADGHDAEGWVWGWLANWRRGGEEGEGEGGECELHCGFWMVLRVEGCFVKLDRDVWFGWDGHRAVVGPLYIDRSGEQYK